MSKTKATLQLFWEYSRHYPGYLWGIAITLPLAVILSQVALPMVTADILSSLASQNYGPDPKHYFFMKILAYIALMGVGTILSWRISTWCMWRLQLAVVRDLHQEILSHVMSQSVRFHADQYSGSLVSQAIKLTSAYKLLVEVNFFNTIPLIVLPLGISVVLFDQAFWYVVAINVFVIIFALSVFVSARYLEKLSAKESEANNTLYGQLSDIVNNISAVKSFAAENTEAKQYLMQAKIAEQQGHRVIKSVVKAETAYSTITSGLNLLTICLAIIATVYYHVDLALVLLIYVYTSMLLGRMWSFKSVVRSVSSALGDAARMVEILHTKPEIKDPLRPKKLHIKKGAIHFDNVAFEHPDLQSREILFKNLTLTIQPGERLGLVGHSGAGKTTLARLLLRFIDIDEGVITIDGQDIRTALQADLRENIAYVPQEPLLFHRSIKENITYGRPSATDKEIQRAARKAYADEFIMSLPQGYDSIVGERGVKLSGGQRQRIAIARAILKDAPILVLDEATSALDSESEKRIQQSLYGLMKDRTVIVIAHRLSTIQQMDRIIVLEKGAIIEEGTHNQLLKKNGTYAKLWAHQSGGFIERWPQN